MMNIWSGIDLSVVIMMAAFSGAAIGGLISWILYRLWNWLYRYVLPARYIKPLSLERHL